MNIADYIPNYPGTEDKLFAYNFYRKREFYENRLERFEPIPDQAGKLFKIQIFMQRFLSPYTPYTSCLLFHGMGTGKCVLPETHIEIDTDISESLKLHTSTDRSHCESSPTKDKNDKIFSFPIEKIWNFAYNLYSSTFKSEGDGNWLRCKNIKISSRDENTNKNIMQSVKHIYRQMINEKIRIITFESGTVLRMTKLHRIYDSLLCDFTNEFYIGQKILIKTGIDTIIDISEQDYFGWVYDFEMNKFANYFANNILSHNTCVASAIVENFKNIQRGETRRKPALVFVKSDELKRNYIREITRVCTKGVYVAKESKEELRLGVEMNEEARERRINREIASTYEFVSYKTFASRMEKLDENILRERYSNREIILDEAHILRIQPAKKEARTIQDIIENTPDEELENVQNLYEQLHKFLHIVENCRILLLTGTPIWDRANEIASLLNLILPLDEVKVVREKNKTIKNQLPTGAKFNNVFLEKLENGDTKIKDSAIDKLRNAFRGRVSFLRPMLTLAKREEIGISKPLMKHITVFPDVMSELQAKHVAEMWNVKDVTKIIVKGEEKERTTVGGTILKLPRDASNMVFPVIDNNTGQIKITSSQADFDKMIKKTTTIKGKTIITYSLPSDKRIITELKDNLSKYSVHFSSIINFIKENQDQIFFVYLEFVTGFGGAIMFGLLLQLHGLLRATAPSDIASKPVSGKKRFVIVSSNPTTTHLPKQISKMLESASQPDNKYAERLQVIVGSEKIAVGLSIRNVRQIHLAMPHWNLPSLEQAMFRGIRVGSHNDLPENERFIKIYRHLAVAPGNISVPISFPPNSKISIDKTKSIDLYIYDIAENKESENAPIVRLLKEMSVDCPINYKRNVLDDDTEGSRDCDYRECNYICDNLQPFSKSGKVWNYELDPKELDGSTFQLYYAETEISNMIQMIAEKFAEHFSLSQRQLRELLRLQVSNERIFYEALHRMLQYRLLLRNSFGFLSYLKECGGILFLDNSTTSEISFSQMTYIENPHIVQRLSLTDIVSVIEMKRDLSNVCKLVKTSEYEKTWDNLAFITKIVLIEYIFELLHEDSCLTIPQKKILTAIYDLWSDRMRKMTDGNYVHTLYSEEYKGLAYDVTSKTIRATGQMKIYDPETSTWKFITNREIENNYIEEIRKQNIEQQEIGFENNPYGIYGWISKKDKMFRLVLKSEKAQGRKGKSRGRKYDNYNITELLDIIINRLRYFPAYPSKYFGRMTEEMVDIQIAGKQSADTKYKEMAKTMNLENKKKLLYLLSLKHEELRKILRDRLEELNLVYTI